MKTFIKILGWVFATIFMVIFLGNCLTFPNIVTNVIGVFLFLLYIIVTIQTRCFTNIGCSSKKDKKEED